MTSYTPKGVCSRQINIEVNGDTIESVQFVGGCNGNTHPSVSKSQAHYSRWKGS